MTPEREIPGYFFTTDANTAYTYASRSARETKGKPRVIAAKLNLENPYDATKDIKKFMKTGMTFSDAKKQSIHIGESRSSRWCLSQREHV